MITTHQQFPYRVIFILETPTDSTYLIPLFLSNYTIKSVILPLLFISLRSHQTYTVAVGIIFVFGDSPDSAFLSVRFQKALFNSLLSRRKVPQSVILILYHSIYIRTDPKALIYLLV